MAMKTIQWRQRLNKENSRKYLKILIGFLSACETGVDGNGEEINGFGELAQQSGAKSVIASLWLVPDESTKELMVGFFRNLKNGKVTSKIESLGQAQLELAGLEISFKWIKTMTQGIQEKNNVF